MKLEIHVHIHDSRKESLERIEKFMSTVAEVLTRIDEKTDNLAKEVSESRNSLANIKTLIQDLKDKQNDPALISQAEQILAKLTKVDSDLSETQNELDQTGKNGTV